MDNERTADVLQVALASYDRKELRVQKNYLEEQNPVLACTCFLNGHKLLQELQQGHNFDIVVLCSQMEDMSSSASSCTTAGASASRTSIAAI